MPTDLSDLLVAKTKAEQLAELLTLLQTAGFPVTSWASGDVGRTLVEVDAEVLADLSSALVSVAGGGLVDLAAGGWLTLLAANHYGLTRRAAVFALGVVLLEDAAGTGPHAITAGQLWFQSTSGKRFTNTGAGTLAANGRLVLAVKAESPGADWNVDAGDIDELLTSLPGVGVTNWFGPVALTGSGLATVLPVANGTPTSGLDVVIKITTAGAVGVAEYQYSLDAGATYNGVDLLTAASVSNPMSVGIDLLFDATAGNFVLNELYTFSRSTWITTSGTDEETDAALRVRCTDRWGDLGPAATAAWYRTRALEADTTLTRVFAEEDGSTAGEVDVTIATAAGAPSAAIVAAVQAYLDERKPLTVTVVVAAVTVVPLTLTGVVYYDPTVSDSVEADVAQALLELRQGLDIGGRALGGGSKGLARFEIAEAVMTVAGVVNLNLTGPAADTTLSSDEIVSFTNSLTFTEV